MKSCKEINEIITLYVDNELDEKQRIEFEEYIQTCQSCREELEDIMYVANLCRSIPEEELPGNFKEQLHRRLVEEKEKQEHANKATHLRNRYIKICSTIAAGLLLVIFLKGFLNNGYFISGSINEATKNENMQEAPKAALADESMAAKSEGAKSEEKKTALDSVAKGKADSGGIHALEAPKGESDRAEAGDGRNGIGVMTAAKPDEGISRKSISITINAGDTGEAAEKVKKRALDNGAVFYDEIHSSDEEEFKVQNIGGASVLSFKVPNSRYEQFVNSLKESSGTSRIEFGEVYVEDTTAALNDLNTRLADVENRINTGERNVENVSNPEELNRLREERKNIMDEIERIRFDSDYTFVTITIDAK